MKISSIFITLLFLIGSLTVFAQSGTTNNTTIKGQIIDSVDMQTIPYATLRIFSKKNLLKPLKVLATDDNGYFEFGLTEKGEYHLAANFTGKSTLIKEFSIGDEKKMDIGKLLMKADDNTLKEVTVTAMQPLVKVDFDKITYSLESDPESTTSTVLDMMKKVPMLTVDSEDNIQLKGSSNFKIYLNGKPSDMITKNPKDVLKSMPANTIKDIEVITDPGAKYDAEGVTGIINIITQKNSSLGGYTGSVNAGVDQRGGYNGGLYGSVKAGKWGVTGNVNYNKNIRPASDAYMNRESFVDDVNKYLSQSTVNKGSGNGVYGRIEISYEIDTLNLINVNFGGYGGGYKPTSTSRTIMQDVNRNTIYEFQRWDNNKYDYGSQEGGIDYQRTFSGVKDRLFTASYKLSLDPRTSTNNSAIDTIRPIVKHNELRQVIETDEKEHTFQLDFTTPFAKIHTLEAGVKYIIRLNNSDNKRETMQADGSWKPTDPDDKYKQLFNHRQDIIAGYAGYSVKIKKMGFKTGLRYESTQTDAKYPLNSQYNFKADYSNLVPSASITYQLKPMQSLRLNYNMRISRPGIWQLNPYPDKAEGTSISQGNPDLKPSKSNNISANYSFFNPKLNFNVYLSQTMATDVVEYYTTVVNGIRMSTYENMGKANNTYLSIYGRWAPVDKFSINMNASISYMDAKSIEFERSNSGFSQGIGGGIQYTMPWKLRFNANAGYWGDQITFQGSSSGFNYYSFSFTKSFLKDKMDITARVSNPFTKELSFKNKERTDQYQFESIYNFPRRYFGIQVSWRFGEMKAQIKKATRTISNDDAMGGGGQQQGGQGGGQ